MIPKKWLGLLHRIGTKCSTTADLNKMLEEILDAAIIVTEADFGAIQIIRAKAGDLDMVVHRGYPDDWVDYWQAFCKGQGAFGELLKRRFVSEDVTTDPFFNEEAVRVHLDAGVRSGQSTPLLSSFGYTVGVISTSSRAIGKPSEDSLMFVDLLARHAADMIDRIMLEDSLRYAILEREDVLAVVAHDVRNPLLSISMQAEILRLANANNRRHVAMIKKSVMRIEKIIANLLDATRLEHGSMHLNRTSIDLYSMISTIIEMQRPIVSHQGISIDMDVDNQLPEISADVCRLMQVFENLITNATKFTPKGGRITVSAKQMDDGILFSVADTGIGIDPVHLPHVFDRFWQAKKHHGTGLGLAIAKGVVEAHGGKIWAESECSVGSTFYFNLPANC